MRPRRQIKPEVEARLREMAADHWTYQRMGAAFGVSAVSAFNWVRELGIEMPKRSGKIRARWDSPEQREAMVKRGRKGAPEVVAQIGQLLQNGGTFKAVAAEVGMSKKSVWYIAVRDGFRIRAPVRVRTKKAYERRDEAIEVPPWVPSVLHDGYLSRAALVGEEEAASQFRVLKREMTRPSA